MNKDVFESVCAFLNRDGGELLIGVRDDGEVVGIDKEAVDDIKKNLILKTYKSKSKVL